ncbi:MAG: hypothetical protein VZQ75_02455 [Candidatus Faecousia sp.]|nr:hypothetical protein [Candidatus Faecousia sp.]
MKKILALTLVLVLVLAAFVGCKKTDATDKNGDAAAQKTTEAPLSEGIVGWYKAETVNGMSFTEWMASMFGGLAGEDETAPAMSEEELKEKLTSLGIDLDNFMSMELLEDGTAVMSSMGITSKGTWTQDGENVTVTTNDGTEQKGTFDGSRLTLKASSEQMETTVVFVKAQKPAEPEVDPELLNNDPNNIVGIYHVSKINGQPLEEYVADAAKESGVEVDTFLAQNGIELENYMPMTIRSDNTVEIKAFAIKMTGTWALDGETLTITMDQDGESQTTTGTFANGEIVIGEADQLITYVKG